MSHNSIVPATSSAEPTERQAEKRPSKLRPFTHPRNSENTITPPRSPEKTFTPQESPESTFIPPYSTEDITMENIKRFEAGRKREEDDYNKMVEMQQKIDELKATERKLREDLTKANALSESRMWASWEIEKAKNKAEEGSKQEIANLKLMVSTRDQQHQRHSEQLTEMDALRSELESLQENAKQTTQTNAELNEQITALTTLNNSPTSQVEESPATCEECQSYITTLSSAEEEFKELFEDDDPDAPFSLARCADKVRKLKIERDQLETELERELWGQEERSPGERLDFSDTEMEGDISEPTKEETALQDSQQQTAASDAAEMTAKVAQLQSDLDSAAAQCNAAKDDISALEREVRRLQRPQGGLSSLAAATMRAKVDQLERDLASAAAERDAAKSGISAIKGKMQHLPRAQESMTSPRDTGDRWMWLALLLMIFIMFGCLYIFDQPSMASFAPPSRSSWYTPILVRMEDWLEIDTTLLG